MKIEDVNKMATLINDYRYHLEQLKKHFHVHSGSLFFNGYNQERIQDEYIPEIRRLMVDHQHSKCHATLNELERYMVEVDAERDMIDAIRKKSQETGESQ